MLSPDADIDYNLLPRRPPFRRVESVGMGVTSSARKVQADAVVSTMMLFKAHHGGIAQLRTCSADNVVYLPRQSSIILSLHEQKAAPGYPHHI